MQPSHLGRCTATKRVKTLLPTLNIQFTLSRDIPSDRQSVELHAIFTYLDRGEEKQ